MTEAEWLTSGDLRRHVEFMRLKNLARKLRLMSVSRAVARLSRGCMIRS